jgi:hypothetical protein
MVREDQGMEARAGRGCRLLAYETWPWGEGSLHYVLTGPRPDADELMVTETRTREKKRWQWRVAKQRIDGIDSRWRQRGDRRRQLVAGVEEKIEECKARTRRGGCDRVNTRGTRKREGAAKGQAGAVPLRKRERKGETQEIGRPESWRKEG